MNKQLKTIGYIVWAALTAWGAIGVAKRMFSGELVTNYGSYVPWGLWVAAKVYFVGLGVGISMFVWIVYAFRLKRFYPVVRTALMTAAITVGMGVFVIAMDLGRMWRAFEVLYRPNFTSLLAWATWLTFIYLGYIIFALAMSVIAGSMPEDRKRVIGWIGLFLAIAFSGGNGAEFGALIASPYWHSTLGPIMSIFGAMLSGTALLLAIICIYFKDRLPEFSDTVSLLSRIVAGLIVAVLILEWAEFSISSWYGVGEAYELRSKVLFGQYWYVFWVVHLLIGSIAPLLLLLSRPAGRLSAGLGGGLAAVAYFAVRLNLVIPGQLSPAMKGLQEAYVDNRLMFTYFPSPTEWAVVVFFVCMGIAAFYIGNRILPDHGQNI